MILTIGGAVWISHCVGVSDDDFEDVVFDQVGAKIFEPGKGINLVLAEYRLLALIKRRYPVCVVVKQAMTAAGIKIRLKPM